MASVLFFLAVAGIYGSHGYQIIYKNESIGFVRDLSQVSQAFEALEEEYQTQYGDNIILDDLVQFTYETRKGRPVLDVASVQAALLDKGYEPQRSAAHIFVNGTAVAVVDSVATAQGLLDEVLQKGIVLDNNETLKEAVILDDIKIEEALVGVTDVEATQEVMERFQSGLAVAETYQVQPNDTLWTIAVNRGMSVEALASANPNMDPTRLRPGDTIVIEQVEPLFRLRYVKDVVRQENVAFAVEYTTDDTLYKGKEKVIREGQVGIQEVTHAQTFEGGVLVEDRLLGSVEVKAPVAQIVAKGTKEWPVYAATGRFVMPATGRILGLFGSDRGSYSHKGVDICQWSRSATGIYAADAGTVTAAVPSGYNGGRGIYVEISHGNGLSTAYYHFSSILVTKGQSVAQGQQIGIMGTTGNSSGIHLHFEVRVNGTPVNPNNYFGYFRNGLDVRALQR
jgi:murein DD-endopeptidase MepM/ murein hydrolase activator NlpD